MTVNARRKPFHRFLQNNKGNIKTDFSLTAACLTAGSVTPLADRRERSIFLIWILAAVFGTGTALYASGPMAAAVALAAGVIAAWLARPSRSRRRRALWSTPFPPGYEKLLLRRIPHYSSLDEPGRELFRQRTRLFLDEVIFHGAGVKVTDGLRLRAAAAAVTPTLGFEEWEWPRLQEIIFRPEGYEHGVYQDDGGVVTEFAESGMVGAYGVMSGTMMLSSRDLLWEFANPQEGANVGFHEFAHLMTLQGLVAAAEDQDEWQSLMRSETAKIKRNESLLDEYALLNEDEFFAVASELFFTIPRRFRNWHPKLYAALARRYRQDPSVWLDTGEPEPDSPPRRRRRRVKIRRSSES